jgi:hypothetical protein
MNLQVAMSTTMAIRCDETLGLRNKLTRAMFCSVVMGKNLMFFSPPEKLYEFNMTPETEVEDFDHHIENVPYATILYHSSFLPLFQNSHHVFC